MWKCIMHPHHNQYLAASPGSRLEVPRTKLQATHAHTGARQLCSGSSVDLRVCSRSSGSGAWKLPVRSCLGEQGGGGDNGHPEALPILASGHPIRVPWQLVHEDLPLPCLQIMHAVSAAGQGLQK